MKIRINEDNGEYYKDYDNNENLLSKDNIKVIH